jgi:hypothetical protein
MRKVNKLGIFTLADLLNASSVYKLKELLIGSWNRFLFFDAAVLTNVHLPERYRSFLQIAQFGEYWEKLSDSIKRNAIKKQKDKLIQIILTFGTSHQMEIGNLILCKWPTLFTPRDTKSPSADCAVLSSKLQIVYASLPIRKPRQSGIRSSIVGIHNHH